MILETPRRQYSVLKCVGWICAYIIWVLAILAAVFSWFGLGDYTALMIVAVVVMGPPLVLASLNFRAFPLPYSVFGRLQRTPLPETDPVLVVRHSWVIIGGLLQTFPFVTWQVYPTGIGIRALGFGAVFLPSTAMTSVKYGWPDQCVISHTCLELRSPVKGPAAIGKAIEATWKEQKEHP